MNSITLIKNFIYQELDEFKSNFDSILQSKIAENKLNSIVENIGSIFAIEKDLNKEELDFNVIDILQESIRQRNNISLILEDNFEVILKPRDSEKILLVFDHLNENNQVLLINNIIKSKVHFDETVNFCSSLKEKERHKNV